MRCKGATNFSCVSSHEKTVHLQGCAEQISQLGIDDDENSSSLAGVDQVSFSAVQAEGVEDIRG